MIPFVNAFSPVFTKQFHSINRNRAHLNEMPASAAEAFIEKSGINYTILRLPAVHGKDDSYISRTIVPRLMQGFFYFSGAGERQYSTLYVKNLVCIIEEIIKTGPLNDSFNCTDFSIKWKDFIKEYAKHLKIDFPNKKKPLLSLLLHPKDRQYQLMITFSYFGAHFPNDKLVSRISWRPEHPWQEGVKEAVKHLKRYF